MLKRAGEVLHWLAGNAGLTLATWGLVLATYLLYRDSKKRGKEQRERWRREDEQASTRERKELLNDLIEQFNSPLLLITRAELAYQLIEKPQKSATGIELGPKLSFRLPNQMPPQAWTIADFLERLARRWLGDSLDTDVIDLQIGDYLLIFAKEFQILLEDQTLSAKYPALNSLHKNLDARREHDSEVAGVGRTAAGYDKARAKFWYSEYKLFRLLPSELPPLPSKSDEI